MSAVKSGRPSLMAQRRAEIVEAFIALVASNGLEEVTLDDIAAKADIQRSSLRHYVGNRRALINAAIVELSDRSVRGVREFLSGAPDVDELITMMFSPAWLAQVSDNDRAFQALVEDAARNPQVAERVRQAADAMVAEVQVALRHTYPDAPAARIREVAYALVCLVEHNKFMQRLGYSRSLSRGAARAARALVRELDE